ncbi:hypothetical protein GQ53DRAFT_441905 [Thozetella sp. PMI_491]|nr:hypothetical protein GQ53DRAFT_441905 [Thozetella sp. PMI_491]
MAGQEARRSSRARTTQGPSNVSSTSSSLSGRAERNTRSFKASSPQKSSSGSLSSEPPEDSIVAEDISATRRSTRGQDAERIKPTIKLDSIEMGSIDDNLEEEDEAVRCICGYDEYPGPPPLDEDTRRRNSKEGIEIDPIFAADVTDDAAGFFVQCDICKVWQHGACVGIMTEESSPEEYFCEECRKDLHKISTASNGQKYSHYLPLKRQATSSRGNSVHKDARQSPAKERETRNGRAGSTTQSSKRRSTMNSQRYDEEEALRRAIEASKEDAAPDLADLITRRPKRGRSDSEEKVDAKRQRTSSRSLSPFDKAEDSDDAGAAGRSNGLKTKSRAAVVARNQRVTEKEERERLRAEQASRRKGRAERRRADDSDPSEELPLAARAAAHKVVANGVSALVTAAENVVDAVRVSSAEAPPSSQPAPDTPPLFAPSSTAKIDKKRSHKKKGRNQYTRDREDEGSPARSQSRDIKDDHGPKHGDGAKSHSKSKGGMGSKVTIADMKRRATSLLGFITQTQMELAAEDGLSSEEAKSKGSPHSSVEKKVQEAGDAAIGQNGGSSTAPGPDRAFKDLSCMEMMDRLTTRLVKWQQEYGA